MGLQGLGRGLGVQNLCLNGVWQHCLALSVCEAQRNQGLGMGLWKGDPRRVAAGLGSVLPGAAIAPLRTMIK